jgi:Type II secretion system (T2SS), protein E, N-terminal domain
MAKRLGELLIEAGAITPADLEGALAAQASGDPERVGEILVARGRLDPTTLARALSHQSGLPFIELEAVPAEVSDLLPLDLQVQNRLTPFEVDRTAGHQVLHVAIADPGAVSVIEDLSMQLGMAVKVYVASSDQIEATHAAYQGQDPIVWPHPSPGHPTAPVALGSPVAPVAPMAPVAPVAPLPEAPRKLVPAVPAAPKLNVPAAPVKPLPRKPTERPRTSPPSAPVAAAHPEKREPAPPPPAAALEGVALPDWLAEPQDASAQRNNDRALQLKLETLFAHGGLASTEAALATVVALLIRRGLLREREVLDALGRK